MTRADSPNLWSAAASAAAWIALLAVLGVIIAGRLQSANAAQVSAPAMSFQEWCAIADECAESLFSIDAQKVGATLPAVDGELDGFFVPNYNRHFVYTKNVSLGEGESQWIETRFVVLTRASFPELHRLYRELEAAGQVPLEAEHQVLNSSAPVRNF